MCLLDEEEQYTFHQGGMNSITDQAVIIQTSLQSAPSTLSWFGEVAVIVSHPSPQLRKLSWDAKERAYVSLTE